jgi:IS1 family transposase
MTDLDELQTFVGNKRHKIWIWTAVAHWRSGILAWVVGDAVRKRLSSCGALSRESQSFWYVSDGYPVDPVFIADDSHLIRKTYMTRVEGENTRLRHYLARLHRKTLCYSLVS